MKSITPGYRYELASMGGGVPQVLQFIEKQKLPDDELVTVQDGTTNEEVLKMLIDRIQFLNQKAPSRENALAITKLEEGLMWLEKRTANRKARGVEGTAKP